MAEINIEPKRKSSAWPWILGILVIIALLVIWYITSKRKAEPAKESFLNGSYSSGIYAYTSSAGTTTLIPLRQWLARSI